MALGNWFSPASLKKVPHLIHQHSPEFHQLFNLQLLNFCKGLNPCRKKTPPPYPSALLEFIQLLNPQLLNFVRGETGTMKNWMVFALLLFNFKWVELLINTEFKLCYMIFFRSTYERLASCTESMANIY